MVVSHREKGLSTKGRVGLVLVFFLACYGYLWLFVQPRVIYDGFGTVVLDVPVFAAGGQFLREALDVPGGLTVYAYGLLSQGFCCSWLGALVVVLTALCLGGLAQGHYVRAGPLRPGAPQRILGRWRPGPKSDRSDLEARPSAILQGPQTPHFAFGESLPYFPPIFIFLLYSRYDHPLAAGLTLSLGLLLSLVFEKLPLRRVPLRVVVFGLLAGISYWLGGAGSASVFALMTVIHLLFRRAWLAALLALPVTAGIIWILADHVFYLSPRQAFLTLIPFRRDEAAGLRTFSRFLVVLLYAFVPVSVSLLGLWRLAVARDGDAGTAPPRQRKGRKTRAAPAFRRAFLAHWQRLALPAVPVTVLAVGLYGSSDRIHRHIVRMNALSRQGRWAEVLELGARLPQKVYSIYANHDIDRALYGVGRLPYDMFCFSQNPHALLLTHEEEESCMTQLKMCDAFIELGNVDLAEKLASEFLVTKGHLGFVLEKLAWISLIKGQDDTARVYLQALRKDWVCRNRAEAMLHGLDHGFEPEAAAYIRRIRSYIRRRDAGRLNRESIEEMLTGLLEQNPRNRMAFEYLMACYLLAGQVDKIAARMGRLEELGYREVPTLYEEAMLISYGARRQSLDLKRFPISRGTLERYERFVRLNDSMQTHNRQAVLEQLVREFGTSYFFYYRFEIRRASAPP
jgi:hypothetical protein